MSPRDRWRVEHMVEAAEQALAFVAGRSRGDLDADMMLRKALTRAVQIIGEAATQMSAAGRAELPRIPWRQITGTRNRLVHPCFDVDADILWVAATVEVAALLAQMKSVAPKS